MRGFIANPSENSRIHCLVLVIDSAEFPVMEEEMISRLRDIRAEANKRCKTQNISDQLLSLLHSDLYPLVLLTKVDKIAPDLIDNVHKTFHSVVVGDLGSK